MVADSVAPKLDEAELFDDNDDREWLGWSDRDVLYAQNFSICANLL